MSGVAGRSGRRHTLQSIARDAQMQLEAKHEEIIATYIRKGIEGDSAILQDLMNRIAGKVKSTTELEFTGLSFNPSELYIAYRKARQIVQDGPKLLEEGATSPESQNNGTGTDDVIEQYQEER
ncbi:MAG TPA: hypothetical protein VMW45_00680 [Dehalococcoidia bacterium]|nr:hypothetical protein [Dehalococcoidia bacterium]